MFADKKTYAPDEDQKPLCNFPTNLPSCASYESGRPFVRWVWRQTKGINQGRLVEILPYKYIPYPSCTTLVCFCTYTRDDGIHRWELSVEKFMYSHEMCDVHEIRAYWVEISEVTCNQTTYKSSDDHKYVMYSDDNGINWQQTNKISYNYGTRGLIHEVNGKGSEYAICVRNAIVGESYSSFKRLNSSTWKQIGWGSSNFNSQTYNSFLQSHIGK